MGNRRIFYACQAVGIASYDTNPTSYKAIRGLQSIGINTKFNLEQVFEIGQLAIYENLENLPDIEVSLEKVLDGYAPIYLLCTQGAPAATIVGRSNQRANLALSIFPDTNQVAATNALTQCICSGLYVSQFGYDVQVEGNAKESVTLVGNNKVWTSGSGITFQGFTAGNGVTSFSPAATEGVDRRQHVVMASSLFPQSIPGIDGSNMNVDTSGIFGASIQSFKVSANLGRDQLLELGRKGPYFRYVNFPVEVSTSIDVNSKNGDQVVATEDGIYAGGNNLIEEPIKLTMLEGLVLDMGVHNKLSSVNYGGANAGSRGGNGTMSFSYITYNDCTVQHPADPTSALRPS